MNEEYLNDRTGSADSGRLHAKSGSRCVAFDQPPRCQDRQRLSLPGSWFSFTLCCCVQRTALTVKLEGKGTSGFRPRLSELPSCPLPEAR